MTLALLSILIVFSLFIIEESIRLEKVPNTKPLIIFKIDSDIQNGEATITNEHEERYKSLGFILKDRYLKDPNSSEDNIAYQLIGRGFYLFGKFRLWEWIS